MRIYVGCQMGLYLGHAYLHNASKVQSADFSVVMIWMTSLVLFNLLLCKTWIKFWSLHNYKDQALDEINHIQYTQDLLLGQNQRCSKSIKTNQRFRGVNNACKRQWEKFVYYHMFTLIQSDIAVNGRLDHFSWTCTLQKMVHSQLWCMSFEPIFRTRDGKRRTFIVGVNAP